MVLKRLEQPAFVQIVKLTDSQAKKQLLAHGVLGDAKQLFKCWKCKEDMAPTKDKQTLRCSNAQCSRPRLCDPVHAWTPLMYFSKEKRTAFTGEDEEMHSDYAFLLRTAYCVGCKMPNDSMVHMVRGADDPLRGGSESIQWQ